MIFIFMFMFCVSVKVHEELVGAIKDAEEGLFQLKRARLLQEADIVLRGLNNAAGVKPEHTHPPNGLEPERKDSDGSKCRFRHSDGRWYNGRIIGFEGSDSAKISFLTPTSESMMVRLSSYSLLPFHYQGLLLTNAALNYLQMCKFFMQQRCRFGSSCRLSHGM